MANTITVYIPVELTTETKTTETAACGIANSIRSMINSNYYCVDNVYDTASEFGVDIAELKLKYPITHINTEAENA